MNSWGPYLSSIIVCSLSCGIISQLLSDSKTKTLMHLICGTILTITILSPITQISLEEILPSSLTYQDTADFYIAEGKKAAANAKSEDIKAACESYILDRAKTLGADLTIEIVLDEHLIPAFAELECSANPDVQMDLQSILTRDLGIPKENQKWTWNQESSIS